MGVHHHGYVWVGAGADYGNDAIRRPGGMSFESSHVAPIEPANWLLKSRKLIKGTFDDIEPAVTWFGEQITAYAERFDGEHAKAPETIARKLEGARESLTGERDVVGGWWGNGGSTFYAVHLVACPNFWRPDYSCPRA